MKGIPVFLLAMWLAFAPEWVEAQTRRQRDVARQITAGAAAYEDGLYPAAHRFFEQAMRKANEPAQETEALLWLLRAKDQLGQYDEILRLLNEKRLSEAEPVVQQVLRTWRARAWFAQTEYAQVIDELARVDPSLLSAAEASHRLRLLGQAYREVARFEAALRVFEEYDRDFAGETEADENLLDWAGTLLDMERNTPAESVLQRLAQTFPDGAAAQTARLWLGVMATEQGALEQARVWLLALIERTVPPSDRAAEAWFALARIEEMSGNPEGALTAWMQGQAVTRDRGVVNRGRIAEARVHFALGQWTRGMELLTACIQEMQGHPVAAEAQLELATAFLDQERHEEALIAFQHYLDAFEDPEGRANALLGRAWSLLGLRRPLEAASSFERAYALHPGLMEREQALFKVADAYFLSGQYERAREEYFLMTQAFPGSGLVPMALFQAAESLARLPSPEEALAEFRAIEDAYPGSPYAEQAAMRIGALNEELGRWERAISAYNRLMTTYPSGALFAEALHRRGLIRYRLGLFREALRDFESVVARAPQTVSAEQAFYMRGWSLYLLGENVEALAVCETFVRQYPGSAWVPDVLFWLASYHFNQGLFAEAEDRFLALLAAHPGGTVADQALYWTGRAAMEQEEYLRAIDHFSRLAREYPQSAIMPQVRFAQGDTLSRLGEFAGAILAFREVIRRYPDDALVEPAWGRKGDCQFTLGDENPERFQEAILSYQSIVDSPRASAALKLQAEYKIGRALEKLGDDEAAFDRYLQVVYDYVHSDEARGAESATWFTRAAFTASAVQEGRGEWEPAIQLLQRVVEAGVPAAPDAERRIQKIRQERASS